MLNTSLYQICRLCMAALDRDAIDCSRDENCELRENIEMIYNVTIKSTDEFTTKICSHCSEIVVTSTMQYIRVSETQTNISAALRLRKDISDSVKRSQAIAGVKRPRSGMQSGPYSKRVRVHSNDDEMNGYPKEKPVKTKNIKSANAHRSRPSSSTKKSPAKPIACQTTKQLLSIAWEMNNQLLPNTNIYVPPPVTAAASTSTNTFELFKLQKNYTKPVQISNLSNFNLENHNYLSGRKLASMPSTHYTNCSFKIQNEFLPKKKVINSLTAAEAMKRIVAFAPSCPRSANASKLLRASNSLYNVANELYKHSAATSGCSKIKRSTIAELTRKMSQLRLSVSTRGSDIWSRLLENAA